MCTRCADYDYPIADCWRPCYVPRRQRSGVQVNIHDSGEDYFFPSQTSVKRFPLIIASRFLRADSRESFEGVE